MHKNRILLRSSKFEIKDLPRDGKQFVLEKSQEQVADEVDETMISAGARRTKSERTRAKTTVDFRGVANEGRAW